MSTDTGQTAIKRLTTQTHASGKREPSDTSAAQHTRHFCGPTSEAAQSRSAHPHARARRRRTPSAQPVHAKYSCLATPHSPSQSERCGCRPSRRLRPPCPRGCPARGAAPAPSRARPPASGAPRRSTCAARAGSPRALVYGASVHLRMFPEPHKRQCGRGVMGPGGTCCSRSTRTVVIGRKSQRVERSAKGRVRVRGRGAPAARARPGPCRRWGRRASARSARRSAARR